MRKPIFIYGGGGLGREVMSMINSLNAFELRGFLDDGISKGTTINGVPVVGSCEDLPAEENLNIVLAIGNCAIKQRVVSKLSDKNVSYPTVIHPGAILQDPSRVQVGEGSIICAGVILTTDILIGKHVLINLNSTVGHDSTIGDFTSIMPGVNIAGEVVVGEGVLIGSGANIINRVSLGDRSIVGMGAVVLKTVEKDKIVAGVPARNIR